jgi:hypothetical protein
VSNPWIKGNNEFDRNCMGTTVVYFKALSQNLPEQTFTLRPLEEGVQQGVTSALIDLKRSSRRKSLAKFTSRSFKAWGKTPGMHWIGDWVGPTADVDIFKGKGRSCPCR